MAKSSIKEIKLELIDEPSVQDRFEINERDIIELAESIANNGLLQNLVVVSKADRFEVVAGHRRLLALRKNNAPTALCNIRQLDNQEIALIRATENLQRQGLSVIEESRIYTRLYDEVGLTLKQIATKMGRSASHIKRIMDLQRMDDLVIQALHEGKIKLAVAEQLERINDRKEKLRFLEIAVENGTTSTVVAMWVDDLRKSLQYLDSREELPPPDIDYIIPEKSYTACEFCNKPVEYRDLKIVRLCPDCFQQIVNAITRKE
jgi:ParB/RepB/Spo0J family partition protein